jgi:hypothetical protein
MYFVVSIILPQTAPFQVVAFGEALRIGAHLLVATPSRVTPSRAVRNETGALRWSGQQSSLRHRARSVARTGRIVTVNQALVAPSFSGNLSDVSHDSAKPPQVLRI